eukprot:1692064-Amphidinium_carterae.1
MERSALDRCVISHMCASQACSKLGTKFLKTAAESKLIAYKKGSTALSRPLSSLLLQESISRMSVCVLLDME